MLHKEEKVLDLDQISLVKSEYDIKEVIKASQKLTG